MGRVTSHGEPGPDQGSSLTNERIIVAKHAKNNTAQAIARTGARTTAAVAVAAAGLLAVSGVANATTKDGDSGSTIQNTEVDGTGGGGGGGGQGNNSADGLVPILNNNDINALNNINVCDVLNNANVDVIEVLSDIDLDLLSESEGGDDAVVGDTGCSNEFTDVESNESSSSDDTTIVGGGGGKDGGKKPSGGGAGGGKGSEDDQVSKKPSGGVDTGDGSTSETDGIVYLLGGLALTAAGGTAFAARRTARQNS